MSNIPLIIKQLDGRIAELESQNLGLTKTLVEFEQEREIRDLEQQANGMQRLIDNWFDINILDNEDIEVVSAVRFIKELRQQAKQLKEQ